MRNTLSFLILALSLGLVAMDADAARRFGGGSNLGKQRAVPTQVAPSAAPATPAQSARPMQPAPPATTPPVAPPKPSFMQRWGGLLAGLGIGALLASLFGAQMGPMVGLILAAVLGFVVIALLARLFMGGQRAAASPAYTARNEPVYDANPSAAGFSGIGSRVEGSASTGTGAWENTTAISQTDKSAVIGGPVEPFLRVAKTSFIRLQAANDAGDLDDIRDYTTPEMYAEIAMQIRDRGGETQKTEVVNVDASVVDAAVEGDYAYASVRFWGLLREEPGANPVPFDEVWHVRRKASDPRDPWVIAGIQQAA